MKRVEVPIIFVLVLICIQQVPTGGLSPTHDLSKWTCTCFSGNQGSQSFQPLTNCSSSCNCSLVAEGHSKWKCICANDGFPRVVADGQETNCFTACHCSSGSSREPESSEKQFSRKVIVIILLLCIILTALAFVSSVLCYVSRRDHSSMQQLQFSSDSSSTKLISHRASSFEEFKVYGSPIIPITGCTHKALRLFRSVAARTQGNIVQFSYAELESATSKFCNSNLIGTGGSSHVYRGRLRDGRLVAVKRIRTVGGPEAESIFSTEIELISRLHHCNLVPLVGYCSENQGKHAERLLVFEYMPGGNLRDSLDGASGKFLDWSTRIMIAIGAARGLEYLHEAAAPKILHRDVKSSNILLDENWTAKITDLGMAKRLRSDGVPSCSSSPARMQGTFGYFAPEYANVGRASLKSDVFSFGVVLLELITGRHPIHKPTGAADESLVIWAFPYLQNSRKVISELPDPHLNGKFPEEEMQVMAYLAKECLLLDPDCRPTMSEVVQILSTIAPKRSQKGYFALNFSQSLSSHNVTIDLEMERPDKWVQNPSDLGDIGQVTSNSKIVQCSPSLDPDQALSTVQISSLNTKSLDPRQDEAVDLTEPRFETFHMANVRCPV